MFEYEFHLISKPLLTTVLLQLKHLITISHIIANAFNIQMVTVDICQYTLI